MDTKGLDKSSLNNFHESRIVHIPVGKVLAGSRAGEPGRDPRYEPLHQTLKIGPFRIDSHQIRNAANELVLVDSPQQAAAICAQRQQGADAGRLCTDAEWERACKGEGQTAYPGGSEACQNKCVSEFNVYELTQSLEWTSSVFRKSSVAAGESIIKGANDSEPLEEHRCARRRPKGDLSQLAFRCCYGAKNATFSKEEPLGQAYQITDISLEELTQLLLSHEKTRDLARNVSLFSERAVETVFARGPGDSKGFSLTHRALIWQPTKGARYLVVAARSGKDTSFVVAYHQGTESRQLAGSFIMKNEPGPLVLAFAESIRPRMHFSTCWGCSGETGKLLFRPPQDIVLLQP